jgi:hypothetical protein
MNIIWQIKKVDTVEEKNGYQNVVVKVYWEAIAKDGQLTNQRHGSVCVALDQSKPFVPLDQLTNDNYFQWVFDSAMSKDDVEYELKKSIESQKKMSLLERN